MIRPFLAAAALLAAAGPALAQNYATVRFQNNSGAVIYSIEASPQDNPNWGGDLLEHYVLNPGQGRDVTFVNVTNCYYDVRVTFTDGSQFTDVLDLCTYNQYNIN
jgi:hypothetical protein